MKRQQRELLVKESSTFIQLDEQFSSSQSMGDICPFSKVNRRPFTHSITYLLYKEMFDALKYKRDIIARLF